MEPETMKIKFNDGTEMLMKKSILARKSEYFLSLFRSDMKENRTNCLQLQHSDANSAKEVMDFLRNGYIQLDADNVTYILEASIYFEIPPLQEKCFNYLSMIAIHNLEDIIELSQLFHKNRLQSLAFQGAAQNFQVALNCNYRFSLDHLRTLFTSNYFSVSSEYDLAAYIVSFIQYETADTNLREILYVELLSYVSLSSIPIHCLLSLYYRPMVNKSFNIKHIIKETYLYHMEKTTNLPLKRYLLPRKTSWSILACSCNVIEQVKLIWPNNNRTEQPEFQFKRFDGKGKIREIIWAFGFLYVFVRNYFIRFDPTWNRWVQLTLSNFPVQRFTVIAFNDFIYKIGGQTGFIITSRVERYSPKENKWSNLCPLHFPIYASSAVVYNGHLVISGGLTESVVLSKEVFTLNLVANKWQRLAPMNYGRYGHKSVVFKDKLYVFGGTFFEVELDEFSEMFTSFTNQWTILKFQARFHVISVWTEDEELFAIEGFRTSRKTKLAKIDLQRKLVITSQIPLPFTFQEHVKFTVNWNA